MAELDMAFAGFNFGAFNQMPFNIIGGGTEDVELVFDSALALDQKANLAADTVLPDTYAAMQLEASVKMGFNTVMPAMLGAIVLEGMVTHARFGVVTIRVDYELYPGQTVVIDANDFTVKTYGMNIMDAHKGAWPIIDDGTYDLSYDALSGAVHVESSLQWTERYL